MKKLPKIAQFVIEGYMIIFMLYIIFLTGFLESEHFNLWVEGEELFMLIFTIMSMIMIIGVGTIWSREFMKKQGRLEHGPGANIQDPMTISTITIFYVKGFVVLPKRWIVERTFAWLGRYRRHSKDYEKTAASSEAISYIAMISLMSKRLENAGN